MDLLPFRAIMAVSKIYETGCIKYGDRNWEKGIPLSRYIDSGLRHEFKWMIGRDDEPHLDMAIWNLLGARDTIARIQEGLLPEFLNDLPCNPYFKKKDIHEAFDEKLANQPTLQEANDSFSVSECEGFKPTGVPEAMAHCMRLKTSEESNKDWLIRQLDLYGLKVVEKEDSDGS